MTDQSASTSPSSLLLPQHSALLPAAASDHYSVSICGGCRELWPCPAHQQRIACGACGCPEWECLDLPGDDQCCYDCGHGAS